MNYTQLGSQGTPEDHQRYGAYASMGFGGRIFAIDPFEGIKANETSRRRINSEAGLNEAQAALTLAQARAVEQQSRPQSSLMGQRDEFGYTTEERRIRLAQQAGEEAERRRRQEEEERRRYNNELAMKQSEQRFNQERTTRLDSEDNNRFWAGFNRSKEVDDRNFNEDRSRFWDQHTHTKNLQNKTFDEDQRRFNLNLAERREDRNLSYTHINENKPHWMTQIPIVI